MFFTGQSRLIKVKPIFFKKNGTFTAKYNMH